MNELTTEILDSYVKNKKLFRKRIRECENTEQLYEFLNNISNITYNHTNSYKIYVNNQWSVPIEDIWINSSENIQGYFYLHGGRSFKNIKDFSYRAELIKIYGIRGTGVIYDD